MDSNENSEDMVIDTSKQMEDSDSRTDDKNEKENQSDKANSEKMETEESNNAKGDDDTSKKTSNNEGESKTGELQSTAGKINTSENEVKTAQSESKTRETENKKENDKSPTVSNAVKEAEVTDMETSNAGKASTPPKDIKDSKRKRKSTNTASESDSALEQNGSPSSNKRKKSDTRSDRYCWRCHKESVEAQCSACPRSWHRRCMGGAPPLSASNWICGECAGILQAENAETRSPAMAGLTVDQLCMMLKHVVERMRDQHGSEPFWKAVDLEEVPNYLDYVVKPMDLSLLESNVRAKLYGSTDAFMADARWIQHNCIVFNTYTSKLTNTAKQMMKVARQEVSEIEACPDCFAHGRNLPRPLPSWFIEPCRRPHPIVWAKLKGFPFWPAKAMPRLNANGLVDVRFFGEHDRAWVSPKDMYLYSIEPPVALPKKKKIEMELCVKEVEDHSKKLEQVFGEFRFAPPKVPYDPHDPLQIQVMLPRYDPVTNTQMDTSKVEVQTPANNKVTPANNKVTPANNKVSPANNKVTPTNNKVSPVNNKVAPAKAEKTPVTAKSTVTASTNGVPEASSEKPKVVRKKKPANSPQPAVNKSIPEIEEVMIIEESKSNSKSPPTTPVTNNNNISTNSTADNSDQKKIDSSPEVTTILEVSRDSPKKVLTVRKIKGDSLKKIKLSKDVSIEEVRKSNANGKTAVQVTSVPRDVPSSLPNNAESPKTPVVQKPKATVVQPNMKKPNLVPVHSKPIGKSARPESKLARALNRVPSKEIIKASMNHVQKNKDDSVNSRPMTAIPMSAKKDQTKAMHMAMNSNVSESARHFGDKESRLNTTVPVIKQEPRDDLQPKLTVVRKAGKARKSFPNKPTSFAQVITPSSSSRPLSRPSPSASDAMVYIPPQNNDVRTYELPPPEAGPATAKIHENSKELANRVAQLIADTIKDAAESNGVGSGSLINHHEATIHYLKLRMERMKWEHQQEISELKHNNELVLRELKASMEVERSRALQDARREAAEERIRVVEETKRKQWCVVCGREAMFYCCWNTAYCDYPCQQKHWSAHIATCAQKTQPQSPRAGSAVPVQPALTSTGPKGQQVMPKLVINRPQQSSAMRRA